MIPNILRQFGEWGIKLKNKLLQGKVYSSLIRELFYQTFIILGVSALIVVLVRYAVRGKFADLLVRIICSQRHVEWDEGVRIYHLTIRNNLDIIAIVVTLIFFFILFRACLSWFTKYFNQIVTGIEQLSEEVDEQIVMSPKLSFFETKLNEVKHKLKKREAEARDAEQRKNELVVYLAHDIRTPLTSVIGYLNLLEEASDMPIELRTKYIKIALDKANRLEKMINEFFEITRYNSQQIALAKENIDLYYMLLQLCDELSPVLAANGNTVALKVNEDLTVYGDPDKLARVFNNVLKNAAAYSFPDTEVTISAEKKDTYVMITFQNKGRTISKDRLSAIFEKFYRLDEARFSNTGGAGLGLAIAKEIITLHGGTITADSKNNEITFDITLPDMN